MRVSSSISGIDRWSATENILWKTSVPGAGNSSPIVWRDRIYLTTAHDGGRRLSLIAYDRASGKQVWEAFAPDGTSDRPHQKNGYASATPATDGERIYVSFGSRGLFAFDLSGKQIWRSDLGSIGNYHGAAGSWAVSTTNRGTASAITADAINTRLIACTRTLLPSTVPTKTQSDRRDPRSGDFATAAMAVTDESMATTSTENSSSSAPAENGRRPPRSATAGAMAIAAHTTPAASPPHTIRRFSATAITRKCDRR